MANLKPVYIDPSDAQLKEPRAGDKFINDPDVTVDSIEDLKDYDIGNSPRTKTVRVLNFYSNTDGGGGVFEWDASEDQANHDGVIIIDPNHSVKAGDSGWWTSENTGSGCFVRVYDGSINVKWAGAKGDGSNADDVPIRKCIEITPQGSIFIPNGVYWLEDGLQLTAANNGIRIYGEGKQSELALSETITTSSGESRLIELVLTDTDIEGITIEKLALNGNRVTSSYAGSSGWGLSIFDIDETNKVRNILFADIWSYGHLSSGIRVAGGEVTVDNVFCYDNAFHGVNTDDGGVILGTNLYCYDNEGNGLDNAGKGADVTNFYSFDNQYGFKVGGDEVAYTKIENGYIYNNRYPYIETSVTSDHLLQLDNIYSLDNGGRWGIIDSKYVQLNNFYSENDSNVDADEAVGIYDGSVVGSNIIILNSEGNGMKLASEANLTNLIIGGCSELGLFTDGSYTNDITIIGGQIFNNENLGIFSRTSGRFLIKGVRFYDDQGTVTQTIPVQVSGNSRNTIVDACTIGEGRVVVSSGNRVVIKDIKDKPNKNSGQATASGDGSETTFTIPHGVDYTGDLANTDSGAKVYLSVTPATVDAVGDFYVTYDGTNITITYITAPSSGTDNLVWNWSIEYAELDRP